ncbi:MAG: nucleotide sugar dehydrogenase [Nitrospinae bacterium]|nr:nucleotide sugar dehydrogenase [Nitrospinota bacterium]
MDYKIGIVGQGFVGSAIREGLKGFYDVTTFDLKEELRNCDSLCELATRSNFIFVCLPTPMKSDGSCYTGILEDAVKDINEICASNNLEDRIIIVKSTVPPGTSERLDNACPNITVVFSPEFLTEANSFDDFKNQTRIIVGGSRPASSKVKTMFRKAFPSIPIVKTSSTHAEMVKYFINCFLSTKVSFANEMYQLCEKIGIDYDKVLEYALYDTRLGKSHFSVPGPDGHFGFGGHCFPKDLAAIISIMVKNDVSPSVLSSVQDKNDEVRGHRDWELMDGRAVIKD